MAELNAALAAAQPNDVLCVVAHPHTDGATPATPSVLPPSPAAVPSTTPAPSQREDSNSDTGDEQDKDAGKGKKDKRDKKDKKDKGSADASSSESSTSSSSGPSASSTTSASPSSNPERTSASTSTAPTTGPSTGTASNAPVTPIATTSAPSADGQIGPPRQDNCTKKVEGSGLSQAVASAAPGDRICVTGESPDRLVISKGGSEGAPIQVIGDGNSVVKGITVKADHVLVEGFQVLNAEAPGIELTGNDITAQNNLVKHPTGGDFDGMRFFGNNIKILHNTITDINPGGGGAHADCMQTFTSGRPSSENVVIDGNRCEKIKNICLMAEGPGDVGDGGGGDGTSANWTYTNNYCEFGASQGLMIEAVQNVTIKNNEFVGNADKAIGLDIGATGAVVDANLLGGGVKADVGMDSSSRKGYQGPEPQGGP